MLVNGSTYFGEGLGEYLLVVLQGSSSREVSLPFNSLCLIQNWPTILVSSESETRWNFYSLDFVFFLFLQYKLLLFATTHLAPCLWMRPQFPFQPWYSLRQLYPPCLWHRSSLSVLFFLLQISMTHIELVRLVPKYLILSTLGYRMCPPRRPPRPSRPSRPHHTASQICYPWNLLMNIVAGGLFVLKKTCLTCLPPWGFRSL